MILEKSKDNRFSKGQSLLEIVFALTFLSLGIYSVGLLIIDAKVSARQATERTQATFLASGGLEAARSIRDHNFSDLTVGTHGIAMSGDNLIFSGTSDTQDQFTREVTVTSVSTDTREIRSTVTWDITIARKGSVSFVTYLTDWQ